MPEKFRFITRFLAISVVCVAVLFFILISPLLLRELSYAKGINWQQLSNVGQTYGASSAILSGIALIGVAFSLLIQNRQAKTERVRIVHDRHMEILQLTMSDPETYGPVAGMRINSTSDLERSRASLIALMWMNYARMGYQAEVLTESSLRKEFFPEMFQSEFTRTWWNSVRAYWLSSSLPDRRARKFVEIANAEYCKAIASGPPAITEHFQHPTNNVRRATHVRNHWYKSVAITSGVVIGVLLRSHIAGRQRSPD